MRKKAINDPNKGDFRWLDHLHAKTKTVGKLLI